MAALARISRKALTSCPASAAQQQSLLHRAFSTEAAKAIRPSEDRVKWDCRGQRKIVPLGQWLPKVAVDAYVSPNVVLAGQINVCDGGSVLRGDLNKITVGFCSDVQERCVIHSAWSSPTGVSTTGNNDRKCFNTASFWLHNHRQTNTLAFNRIGSRAFSTASVESTVPREIRAAESKPIGAAKKLISFTLLPNLALFWHINEGIEEILADYVHQEMTRNLILINLRLFLIILAKDVFLSLV